MRVVSENLEVLKNMGGFMMKYIMRFMGTLVISLMFINVAQAASINVFSFNVLAPPWAKASSYPNSSLPYLDRTIRRQAIINTLNSIKDTTDVICLQETTPIEFGYFASALKDFVGLQANHDPSYWSQYITVDPPWELNGTAIFIKKKVFTNINLSDVALSDSGNHGAYATATIKGTNLKVRIISVHLDSDTGGNRDKEMQAAIQLISAPLASVDMIIGDFNSSPNQGNYSVDLTRAGFVDVLDAVGNTELTTPYTTAYSSSNNFGELDHILARGATPLSGDVIDNNMFVLYPIVSSNAYENDRITANLKLIGSDHFPIKGAVQYNP